MVEHALVKATGKKKKHRTCKVLCQVSQEVSKRQQSDADASLDTRNKKNYILVFTLSETTVMS